jgi:hypothetical protein
MTAGAQILLRQQRQPQQFFQFTPLLQFTQCDMCVSEWGHTTGGDRCSSNPPAHAFTNTAPKRCIAVPTASKWTLVRIGYSSACPCMLGAVYCYSSNPQPPC